MINPTPEIYSQIVIEPRHGSVGAWTVEAIDIADGGIETAVFDGDGAKDRAEAYLRSQYGGPK